MLLVILHNDKEYLEEARKVINAEGISEVSICEQKGLAKSLSGIKDNLFFGMSQPDITDEFDCALIAAVPEVEKVRQIKECLKTALRLYPTDKTALFLKLPFLSIDKLFKNSEEKKR